MNKLTIIYGGQFGSEGKGQVARLLTETMGKGIAVRVGGPNAGHSFYPDGAENPRQVVQTIPVASSYRPNRWFGVIGSAGVVELDILAREMEEAYQRTGEVPSLLIDRFACIITEEHQRGEKHLKKKIGSTGKGVGMATADKIMRNPDIVFDSFAVRNKLIAHKNQVGKSMGRISLGRTPEFLNEQLQHGTNIMIEGTQGYALSLHTSGYYPFCTSRECTPTAMLAQTGINPDLAQDFEKIMVCRTFPIRVGGNSGDLRYEVDWEFLMEETGGYIKEPETTTVTKKARRIAKLDPELIHRAVQQTGPTALCVSFLDYLFPDYAGESPEDFSEEMHTHLAWWEKEFGVPVRYVSTGPGRTFEYEVM